MRNLFTTVRESIDLGAIQKMDDVTNVHGFTPAVRKRNAITLVRVAEAAEAWADFLDGRVDTYLMREAFNPTSDVAWAALCRRYPNVFNEAMTTSDFAALTDAVMNRSLLASYESYEPTWQKVAARRPRPVKDFRPVKPYWVDGGQGRFKRVAQLDRHELRTIQENSLTYSVGKYLGGYMLSWEDVLNDDMGIFADMPKRLAQGGHDSIEYDVTAMYTDANGPSAAMYVNGTNLLTGVLNLENLGKAMAILMNKKDSEGRPISMTTKGLKLVVGDGSLYITAQYLKSMLSVDVNVAYAGGNANSVVRSTNWIMQNFEVVYNPWISVIAGVNAATSWWLFTTPSATTRPCIEVAHLEGYESPVLLKKAANTARIGGGLDETLGDFDIMANEYKGLMVYGMVNIDNISTVASTGTA